VGHIYLDHSEHGDVEAIEAHYYASQLFMPDFSLSMMAREYGKVNVKDIVEIFGVSEEAAMKRIQTMKKRTLINFSRKAQEIWEVQKEKVALYYQCKEDGYNFRNSLSFWLEMKADYERDCRLEAYSQFRY